MGNYNYNKTKKAWLAVAAAALWQALRVRPHNFRVLPSRKLIHGCKPTQTSKRIDSGSALSLQSRPCPSVLSQAYPRRPSLDQPISFNEALVPFVVPSPRNLQIPISSPLIVFQFQVGRRPRLPILPHQILRKLRRSIVSSRALKNSKRVTSKLQRYI